MGKTEIVDCRASNALIWKSPTLKKKRHYEESAHQKAFIEWSTFRNLVYKGNCYGKIKDYLFAIPNGGWRSPREAKIMKAEGITAGISDLFFAFPTKTYHGLWIEFKANPKCRLTDTQKAFQDRMFSVCYKTAIAYCVDDATNALNIYLSS